MGSSVEAVEGILQQEAAEGILQGKLHLGISEDDKGDMRVTYCNAWFSSHVTIVTISPYFQTSRKIDW